MFRAERRPGESALAIDSGPPAARVVRIEPIAIHVEVRLGQPPDFEARGGVGVVVDLGVVAWLVGLGVVA